MSVCFKMVLTSSSLLISLSILRTLISECKRDLPLFARSIIRIVDAALTVDSPLSRGTVDLEVAGRAGVVVSCRFNIADDSLLPIPLILKRPTQV